ncbi:hypothetical protein GCM10023214_65300 [Amycolatopsis dongchuanensis]|uniref:Uncharacterized protein n=1 Tax=Amycolatopsis dongchuanensis TaxID=1070866 RepID=A0ABP8VHK5_9PSEU
MGPGRWRDRRGGRLMGRVRTARRPVPITDAEYLELCECRCPRLPGTHLAGHCGSGLEPSATAEEARDE